MDSQEHGPRDPNEAENGRPMTPWPGHPSPPPDGPPPGAAPSWPGGPVPGSAPPWPNGAAPGPTAPDTPGGPSSPPAWPYAANGQSGPGGPGGPGGPAGPGMPGAPTGPTGLGSLVAPIPRRRRSKLVPAVAAATALAAASAATAFFVFRERGGDAAARPAGSTSSPRATLAAPDACAMPRRATVERLVPQAKSNKDTRDHREDTGYISWVCTLRNDNFSFGEYVRSRSIEIELTRYEADGELTAVRVARNSYDAELTGGKYAETHSTKENYSSKVRTLSGVGEEAFARYTWARDPKSSDNMYSFGQAIGRVGDVVIEVKYQASQQRKDAPIFSTDGVQGVTEENALREVSTLLGEVAASVTAWRNGRGPASTTGDPGGTEAAGSTPEASPSATAAPSPTPIAMPASCEQVSAVAQRYVPQATQKATQIQDSSSTSTDCVWMNREFPAGAKTRLRNVMITIQRFTNRVGAEDPNGAKNRFIDQRAEGRKMAGSGFGNMFWYTSADIKGLGDAAFRQYRTNRTPTVHAGIGQVVVRYGSAVVTVDFFGADRPEGAPLNSPKSTLMGAKESLAGALAVARAMTQALAAG
ncbi:hypothetical protein [Microtetraspora malaysiensis]|uniref:hypothetical protein n=1 Tax=Microtetraspora malaysiensis TaxID=161358 RepID=UPI003D8E7CF6